VRPKEKEKQRFRGRRKAKSSHWTTQEKPDLGGEGTRASRKKKSVQRGQVSSKKGGGGNSRFEQKGAKKKGQVNEIR